MKYYSREISIDVRFSAREFLPNPHCNHFRLLTIYRHVRMHDIDLGETPRLLEYATNMWKVWIAPSWSI